MPGPTKKEHYVPQVYLERFCECRSRVNVYDKQSDEIRINQDILNVASERYFYDIDLEAYNTELKERGEQTLDVLFPELETIDPQYIEHMFGGGIELDYNRCIGTVIDDLEKKSGWMIENCFAITSEQKLFFAFWAGHQILRTKAFRESLSQIHQAYAQIVSEVANRNAEEGEQVIVTARTDKFAQRAMHADTLMNEDIIVHIADTLLQHSWIFTVNRSKIPFVTSDNPIATIPHDFSSGHTGTGFGSHMVEVFFPLSPSIAIMMYEKGNGLEKLDRRSCICSDEDTIREYNYVSLRNATRVIISNSADLNCYQDYARQHPEIKDKKVTLYMGGNEYKF